MAQSHKVLIEGKTMANELSESWLRLWDQTVVNCSSDGLKGFIFQSPSGGEKLRVPLYGYSPSESHMAIMAVLLDELISTRQEEDLVIINTTLMIALNKHVHKVLKDDKTSLDGHQLGDMGVFKNPNIWDFSLDAYSVPKFPRVKLANFRSKKDDKENAVEPVLQERSPGSRI